MTDTLRDRIAEAVAPHLVDMDAKAVADAVIKTLQDDGWTLAPPDVVVFTGMYIGDGRGSYADNFCRGGCDCSCCYGYADEPCHCQDAVCNCGGDRAAHGQKPLDTTDE